MTPKEPQKAPKVVANFVKGQPEASPEASPEVVAKRDVEVTDDGDVDVNVDWVPRFR